MQSSLFGPPVFGRGVILNPTQDVPNELSSAPIFEVSASVIDQPDVLVDQLHLHWVRREPVVIRLFVDPSVMRVAAREVDERPPWKVGASFVFPRQRLHFLIWNNNVDFRSGEPIWWWGRKAIALGAQPSIDGTSDVVLPDGTTAFCDGGPMRPFDISSFNLDSFKLDPFDLDNCNVIPYSAIETGSLRCIRSSSSIAELAADQSDSVHHRGGPARIIAPAGSGKTRVLTERLRHIVSDWNVSPSNVCAVAYNTRAASELKERTAGLAVHIRTLNALALAIVNGSGAFAHSTLESQTRTMLDERGVRNILQNMVELPRKMNTDPMATWIEALSTARLGLQAPDLLEEATGDISGFAEVFERYRSYLTDHGLLDFDEQIYRAIEILLRDPDARQAAQRQCRMLLVDEFQDLTPAHVLMLRLLASPALDVFGVGDDDQVIYGYAGADPRYLVDFDKWFPGAAHHALEINYRCPPSVVEAASNMLTRNALRVDKTIRARSDRASAASDLSIDRVQNAEMATKVIQTIDNWLSEGCSENQIAVLSRVNVTLLPVQILLTEAGISNTKPVSASLLDRTGIRTAFAYLRIALDPTHIARADIIDTIRRPSRKIARNVTDLITKKSSVSLADIRRIATSLSGNDGPRVSHYADDIQAVVDAVRIGDTAAAIEAIRTQVGLGEAMDVLDGSRKEADRSTHADDLAAIAAVAHLHPDVATFEPWLHEVLTHNGESTGVELSTVHRVKGREWDRVVVYDVTAGLMPHRLSSDKGEERRIFHVGLTRGKERVTVLADASSPSPFLSELAQPGKPEVFVSATRNVDTATPIKKSPGMPATIGLALVIPGGLDGTIVDLTDSGAILSAGRARTEVPFGSTVRVNSKLVELLRPRDERTEHLFQALKEWRRTTAADAKIPAFTVLHDSHLEGIAITAPETLEQLAKCSGIGPAKLERWGDEILAAMEATTVPN